MSWPSRLYFWKRLVSFAIHKGPLVGDIETYGTFRVCAFSKSAPARKWKKAKRTNLLRALRFIACSSRSFSVAKSCRLLFSAPQLRVDARRSENDSLYH